MIGCLKHYMYRVHSEVCVIDYKHTLTVNHLRLDYSGLGPF